MKKSILALLSLVALFTTPSCRKVSGEGPTVTQDYVLGNFTSVDAGIDADVYYTQSNTTSVEISAQQNILSQISTPIVNGELRLQFRDFFTVWHHAPITVRISAPYLNGMGINGSGHFYALTPTTSSTLNLKVNGSGSISVAHYTGQSLSGNISGSGDITVSGGSVSAESLQISGSGTMDMLGINAVSASTQTSGSGKTTVNVSNSLDVRISGSGDVYYTGNPVIYTSISGSGKVMKL